MAIGLQRLSNPVGQRLDIGGGICWHVTRVQLGDERVMPDMEPLENGEAIGEAYRRSLAGVRLLAVEHRCLLDRLVANGTGGIAVRQDALCTNGETRVGIGDQHAALRGIEGHVDEVIRGWRCVELGRDPAATRFLTVLPSRWQTRLSEARSQQEQDAELNEVGTNHAALHSCC